MAAYSGYKPEGEVARWLECLQGYDFEMKHCNGSQHRNADALSHYPLSQPFNNDDSSTVVVASVGCPILTERTVDDLITLQQRDEDIGPI